MNIVAAIVPESVSLPSGPPESSSPSSTGDFLQIMKSIAKKVDLKGGISGVEFFLASLLPNGSNPILAGNESVGAQNSTATLQAQPALQNLLAEISQEISAAKGEAVPGSNGMNTGNSGQSSETANLLAEILAKAGLSDVAIPAQILSTLKLSAQATTADGINNTGQQTAPPNPDAIQPAPSPNAQTNNPQAVANPDAIQPAVSPNAQTNNPQTAAPPGNVSAELSANFSSVEAPIQKSNSKIEDPAETNSKDTLSPAPNSLSAAAAINTTAKPATIGTNMLQLIDKLRETVQSNPQNTQQGALEIHLDPPALGKLLLQVALDGSNVKVHLTAATQDAKAILEQHAAALRSQLASSGLNIREFNISLGREQLQQNSQAFASFVFDAKLQNEEEPQTTHLTTAIHATNVNYLV